MPDPTLSADDLSRIRDTYDAVRLEIEPASTAFYDFLFERAPDARRLFRMDDLSGQGMKFMSTLGVIVDALDTPEALARTLDNLGRFHGAIGVKSAEYDPMQEALLDTFDLILGKRFGPQDREAWRRAYEMISRHMIAAGAQEER